MFSPWRMNLSDRMRRALTSLGREAPDGDGCPTGRDYLREILEPLAASPRLQPHLVTHTRVLAVGREGLLKTEEIGSDERARRAFRLLVRGPDGRERIEASSAILDCTGTYGQPNALGASGIPAPGEIETDDLIVRHLPDVRAEPDEWRGRSVLLVGEGHSAQAVAVELADIVTADPSTHVVWAIRSVAPTWGAVEADPLPARAALCNRARELAGGLVPGVEVRRGVEVGELERVDGRVKVAFETANGGRAADTFDRIVSLTGYVGDHLLYRQLQVHECYASTAPMRLAAALLASDGDGADCLANTAGFGPESLSSPEPGFFVLGSKSYGRTSSFLLEAGWAQVDDVLTLL